MNEYMTKKRKTYAKQVPVMASERQLREVSNWIGRWLENQGNEKTNLLITEDSVIIQRAVTGNEIEAFVTDWVVYLGDCEFVVMSDNAFHKFFKKHEG